MWAIAGILIGAFLLLSVTGFHLGPHTHLGGAAVGLLAAAWLGLIAATTAAASVVWVLFALDLLVSLAIGALGWRAMVVNRRPSPLRPSRLLGATGVATSALAPAGTVVVRGESWSAISLDGEIADGSQIEVVGVRGIRLEVQAASARDREGVGT